MGSSNMQMQIIIEIFLRSEKARILKLNSAQRIFLTILASYMGIKDHCWPEYEDLMADTGIASKTTLNKTIISLEKLNIILVKRKHRKNNHYFFDKSFLVPWVHIWTQRVHICTQLSTDMYSNNINNNITNNKRSSNKIQEQKQTAKFWEPGNPDYDRVHKNK
jgi:hypothetical protein